MLRLKDKYKEGSALVIIGGPSIIENKFDLAMVDKNKYTIFLEPKALTPKFIEFGIKPNFLLLFYPEKGKTNCFQHAVWLSFLADVDLAPLIREEYQAEYLHIKDNFDKYFEFWNPQKGPNKKYRYKRDVCFKNSPFDLINNYRDMGLISYCSAYKENMPLLDLPNPVYQYDHLPAKNKFVLEEYFNSEEKEGRLSLRSYNLVDSAAIALFPILKYLGFKKVYLLGLDMSMLWSMEYSALYTFKSLKHFDVFFKKAVPVFNASYKPNFWHKFMRPVANIKALQQILEYRGLEFINIYEPFKYALPLKGIRNISWEAFLSQG